MGREQLRNLPRWTCGTAAAAIALFFMVRRMEYLPVLLASTYLFLICCSDTLTARIPNLLNLLFAATGFVYHGVQEGPSGLLTALLGLVTGLALLLLPYAMGGMGAGDVKTLAALGSLLGASAIFQVFLYMALAGGVLALLYQLFDPNLVQKCRDGFVAIKAFLYTREVATLIPQRRRAPLRFPYATAIAFGFFAYVQWGRLI